ncbi:MAG TPA: hypothetical protein VLW06_04480 [Terriglobales bacterium]|nr:hypothetical protein [Terriglobales bacterium]
MLRRPHFIAIAGMAFTSLFFAAAASAQMAAFRDLTSGSRVPGEHLSIPESCEKSDSTIEDSTPQAGSNEPGNQALQLTIVEVSPAKLEIGNDFNASVRLKNIGSTPVLLPAAADGERVVRTSADGTEEKYEVGDVSFRLLTGKERKIPVYLNSAGALFADPDDKSSYLSLDPGKWLEMKLHARVECGLENCVAHLQPDSKAVLTAWWYQRILTHRVNGCTESHGSIKIRELDSNPFSVVVRNPSAKTKPAGSNLSSMAWR